MFSGLALLQAEFGMAPAGPMNQQHNLLASLIDVSDDLSNEDFLGNRRHEQR
jgi:hypothetical protein